MEVFGYTFDTPVMTAALSHLGNTAKHGMVIFAKQQRQRIPEACDSKRTIKQRRQNISVLPALF